MFWSKIRIFSVYVLNDSPRSFWWYCQGQTLTCSGENSKKHTENSNAKLQFDYNVIDDVIIISHTANESPKLVRFNGWTSTWTYGVGIPFDFMIQPCGCI